MGKTRDKAIQLARKIGAADAAGEASRRAHDNQSRRCRLDLGIFLLGEEDRETLGEAILAQGLLTASELSDINKVTAFNSSTGQWDYLYGLSMSFTVNRTLAGVRVKRRSGTQPATTEQRMAALADTIQRNGEAIEDKTFRDLLHILPPPNSLANIKELSEDPEYNQYLREQGVYIFPTTDPDGQIGPGRDRGEIDPWVERMIDMGDAVGSFYDAVEADEDAPSGIIEAAHGWASKLNGAADLVRFRQEAGVER